MNSYKCIQRIFAIEAEQIETAQKSFPDGFHDGVAVVTFNGVHTDCPVIADYDNYSKFFARMKELGIEVQVNLSTSIGHGDVQKAMAEGYATMVDCEGHGCNKSACIRAENFRQYLLSLVRKYAQLRPSVFWLDDDFRVSHHYPVVYGCFCEHCIATFNDRYGFAYTRESLKQAILQDEFADGKRIRKLWQEYNRDAMVDLAKSIADVVHEVDDRIIIGFMQVNPEPFIYGCPDYHDYIDAAKNKYGEVWFRHGSGFYTDRAPYAVVEKNFSIARLCAMSEDADGKIVNLTEEVTSPYTRREKSMKMTVMEAVMNIGIAGADGVMDEAIKPNLTEQLREESIVAEMHRQYSYLNQLRGLIAEKKQIGVYPFFHRDLWQYNDKAEHMGMLQDMGARYWYNLFYMGVPITFREDGAGVLLLSGTTVRAMEKANLKSWLSKGIYADGSSALEINRILGMNRTGVKESSYGMENLTGAGTSETFTAHELNGSGKGYNRFNYWHGSGLGSRCLESDGAEVLSYSMCQAEANAGVIGMAVYNTPENGRISISDRGAWSDDILSQKKSEQIKNVIDWLYGGKMPVRVESICRVGQSIWEDPNTKERIIFLYNVDYDDATNVRLIMDDSFTVEILEKNGIWKQYATTSEYTVPCIPSWSTMIMRIKKSSIKHS